MKIIIKGIYTKKTQLPIGNLPDKSVIFKEPNSFSKVFLLSLIYQSISFIIICIILILMNIVHNQDLFYIKLSNWGFFLVFLSIVPHEFLHAICFGKKATVELYFYPKHFCAFIVSTFPISKKRFIFMSSFPLILFVIFPLIISFFYYNDIIITFIVFSLFNSSGDLINIKNAIMQMPKESYQQMSGMNSYWFLKKEL